MDERKEKIIQTLPFWDKLSESEKQHLRDNTRFVKYQKDAHIHSCTGSCVGLVMMVSGGLRAYLLSEEGREVTLFRLGPGQICILAASCVISQLTFDAHIVAEKDCEVLVFGAHAFLQLKETNLHVECFLYKLATERFSEVMWAMQQLLFMGFDRRLALFLVNEAEKTGSATIELTHDQIARLTGSAREVVTRMLKRFVEDDLIELKRGKVVITDMDGLKLLGE